MFGSYKKNIEPVDIFIWDWKKAKSGIIGVLKINMIISFGCGLFFGLIGTLVSGVKFGLFFGLAIVLVLGSISSLIFGPLNFLLTGFSGKQLAKRSTRVPNEGMRRSTKNGLIGGVVFGLGFGLFIWLGNGLLNRLMGGFREAINAAASGLSFGLGVGLTIGLVSVLILGLGFGWLAVVQHFILRFWLRCAYTFPLKAVPFLEDATVRILLRRVGGGYSFTHRLLLDHFADRTPLASSAPAAAHLIEPPSKQLPSS